MTKIAIPESIREAVAALNGLGALLTAKEWERAAIVYAFTYEPGTGNWQDRKERDSAPLTIKEFADLGIAGLKSDSTVRIYRRAWCDAVNDGHAVEAEPGKAVALPDLPWPPTDNRVGSFQDRIVTQVRNAEPETRAQVARELLADSDVAEQTVADPETRRNVSRATDQHYQHQAAQRAERTERKTQDDPVARRIESTEWINRLGETAERFHRDATEALRHVGELPESERFWLTGALRRAHQTVEAAERYLELGRSEIDAELQHLIENGS